MNEREKLTEAISAQDPLTILSGIEQFGLAADGSDLRDLRTALEAQAAELAAVKEMYAREGAKALYELERAERAEAQLAEARKALEQAEQQLDYGQVDAAHQIIIRAARRVLTEEQKGDQNV